MRSVATSGGGRGGEANGAFAPGGILQGTAFRTQHSKRSRGGIYWVCCECWHSSVAMYSLKCIRIVIRTIFNTNTVRWLPLRSIFGYFYIVENVCKVMSTEECCSSQYSFDVSSL